MSESRNEQRSVSVRRIEFEVDWPPGHVAAYLIDCDEPILVDAGMTGEGASEELRDSLSACDCKLADIEHLVITHPHTDHVGQVPTVLGAADPTVYVPATVEERFRRDTDELSERVRANARAAGVQGSYLDDAVEMAVGSLERDRELLPPEDVDVWIEHGSMVEVGPLTFEATHVPGHQADHLAYATDIDGGRVLFSGDMALNSFRSVALHDGFDDGYTDGIDAFYTALDRLAELGDVAQVYTGHNPTHSNLEESIANDRDSLDRLLDRTRDGLGEDGKTALEIAFQRSGDRDIRYLVIETTSALAKLERDGEAESETDEHGVRRYTAA